MPRQAQRHLGVAAGAGDQAGAKALLSSSSTFSTMFGRELGMPVAHRDGLGGLDESLGAVGILLEIHVVSP